MTKEELFNSMKALHPNWSDEQIWTAVSLDLQADSVIESAGGDIDPNDGGVFEIIIESAREWLKEQLPVIFEKVKELFANLLQNLRENMSEWISQGFQYLTQIIRSYFG